MTLWFNNFDFNVDDLLDDGGMEGFNVQELAENEPDDD